ncbi:MAG: hypothetical protein EON88_10380 [Brevundimonas sp.]|nr:MAG: hypothetical protein EON88_10380 [Brevundimonas sp.]
MTAARAFVVHAAHEGRGAGHRVDGHSFEDAAVAFVERWSPTVSAEGEVQVIVRDVDDGREHCFVVDVDDGDASPCN